MVGLYRPSTPPGMPPPSARRKSSKLSFGTVCSSNINRSMEAHVRLQNAGMWSMHPLNVMDTIILVWSSFLLRPSHTQLTNLYISALHTKWTIFNCNIRHINSNNTHIAGMRVESYGTGTQVRLPGKSAMEPRIFKFGTPYADMYKSLSETPEDVAFFMHNGVLQLCKRGASVKVSCWIGLSWNVRYFFECALNFNRSNQSIIYHILNHLLS